jgi:hypothetical protein
MEARSQPEAWWIQQIEVLHAAAGAWGHAAGLVEAEKVQHGACASQTAMWPL